MSELTLIDIADTLILRPSEAGAVRRAAARIAELEAKWAHTVDALRAARERIDDIETACLKYTELTNARIAELEAAVLAEREACAAYLDRLSVKQGEHAVVYRECAAAIRARPAP